MKKKKIILVVLKNNNLGDSVIADTAEYLLSEIVPDAIIERMNLFAEDKLYKRLNVRFTYDYPYWKQVYKFIKYYLHSIKGTKIYKFYHNYLKDADAVVFAGGGIIKHTREMFWNPIHTIVNYCAKHEIPVYFNAVGVEGYDEKNFYSKLIKYILNNPIIYKITTRDDIENLKNYVQDTSKILRVGDPALWTKETYQVSDEKSSDVIGIGVIREKIFQDYGVDVSGDDIINMYKSIILELQNRGYKWQIFCNGVVRDYELGLKVLEKLGLEPNSQNIAKRPETAFELVNLISSYKATISARLHANIIATALNIPTVGFVWNDKLKLFGEQLGIADRFFNPSEFSEAGCVVDKLEEAIKEGLGVDKINNLKNLTMQKINKFVADVFADTAETLVGVRERERERERERVIHNGIKISFVNRYETQQMWGFLPIPTFLMFKTIKVG